MKTPIFTKAVVIASVACPSRKTTIGWSCLLRRFVMAENRHLHVHWVYFSQKTFNTLLEN